MPIPNRSRLAFIDWMRGLACILMFQTHCYDSWLSAEARKSTFFTRSQLGGTLPAPMFLFLAGVSSAFVFSKLVQKEIAPAAIARTLIYRGAQVFGFGLLFRLQEYIIAWGWAPWTDLLRVDVLNIIGLSMMLMGLLCWLVLSLADSARLRFSLAAGAMTVAVVIAMVTPMLWTSWRPRWLPWFIESYINGVHTFGQPQSWLFPIFPWSAFAFTGLAFGVMLLSKWASNRSSAFSALSGTCGVAVIYLARWMDANSVHLYAADDFWHTSPNFFLIRLGLLLVILAGAFFWCRWGLGQWKFSPLTQLGQTSLLVYWVHLQFVYGRYSILTKRAADIQTASIGLLIITSTMLMLSIARTRAKTVSFQKSLS
ncbi:MAG: heparan-alpha-glucosaminide N-acetyltransferase domain-containing protein [Acidobacteriota bacterium]|nr:heparan-alpha-glucosaminide N-acetyltransferase domain-containing protein [Acidobacteriota bacterium]